MDKFVRIKNAFNVLRGKSFGESITVRSSELDKSNSNYYRYRDNNAQILGPIINRIAVDGASVNVRHVLLGENELYKETLTESGLNRCLTTRANIDQTGRELLLDALETMLGEGAIAIVPVDVDVNPYNKQYEFDVQTLRVAKILDWYTDSVNTYLYNDRTGQYQEKILKKEFIAIAYNPFYTTMNAPNSTLKRLIDKLALLDSTDTKNGSGKLNIILQLAYAVKSPKRQEEALARIQALENQLNQSKYGIAYAAATEKITQINRPIDNNLFSQIEYLTDQLYSQLGITKEIMNNTASGDALIAYYNRTVFPVLNAVLEAMKRAFLSADALKRGESIEYFPELIKMAPINTLKDLTDSLSRNEVVSANDIRSWLGMRPSDQEGANLLRNSNLYPTEPMGLLDKPNDLNEV